MNIINIHNTPVTDTPHKVAVRKLYDYDTAQAMHITLEPGETLKPHITATDVFFYILEGIVDVQVGDEVKSVGKNNLVESPKDIVHCLSNNGFSTACILVVKAPKPVIQAKLL